MLGVWLNATVSPYLCTSLVEVLRYIIHNMIRNSSYVLYLICSLSPSDSAMATCSCS